MKEKIKEKASEIKNALTNNKKKTAIVGSCVAVVLVCAVSVGVVQALPTTSTTDAVAKTTGATTTQTSATATKTDATKDATRINTDETKSETTQEENGSTDSSSATTSTNSASSVSSGSGSTTSSASSSVSTSSNSNTTTSASSDSGSSNISADYENSSSTAASNSESAHEHNWEWVSNIVTVTDQEAWDEPVYEWVDWCNVCGCQVSDSHSGETIWQYGFSGQHPAVYKQIQTGTIHHDAVTHTEDHGYYQCTGCGATK